VLRVDVGAEALALSVRQAKWTAAIEGGSILAFCALLVLFTRWALRPLELLDEARQAPEGPVDDLAREDDTGFVVETYRRVIEQLRDKEAELRRLRELERHRADELQELNASIVDSMSAGAVVLDMSGAVRTMNDPAREILDVPGSERVTGRPVADVVRHAPELLARLTACLERGEARERDELRLNLPGHGRRDLTIAVSPLRSAEGEQRGVLAIFADTTEVKRLQEQVRLRESMAELGELSAGVAHEFRNSLGTILGFARLVEKQAAPEAREHAEAIAQECTSLRRVVDDFLRFANPARLVVEPVDLAQLFEELGDDVAQRAAGKRVAYEVQPGLPAISGDETLLRRAFTNLVRNACDAAPDGGRVRVTHEAAPREITIHVDDDGPGIPRDERQRVFIPFFTRKEHGTGLGLALARKVVVHHGGRIAVDDAPGGGARLSVTLPVRPA
jgi:PAS domain S-box-containing protein